MPLTKEQYDKLMLGYSRRRDAHHRELLDRKRRIYAEIPEYQKLDQAVPDLSIKALEERLEGRGASFSLQKELRAIENRKKELLQSHGYPVDYLKLQYDCADCKDTGYIDGVKCHCFRQREIRILYQQSHLEQLIHANRFDLLSEAYYQGEDLEHFRSALQSAHHFIRNFDSDYENLFFYGTVGTGKSCLSICTAGELLKSGHSVLYFSSSGLFETISSYVFQSGRREEYRAFLADLYHCDLLVIDDLGTEITNNFVAAQLFALINERDINRKSMIISTNLSLPELRERYSDRIFSRITSNYTIRKLTGPDIRIRKKVDPSTSVMEERNTAEHHGAD